MNSDMGFQEGYARCARAVAGWLRRRPKGLVLSIDIGGSVFDSIALNAATFSNNEFLAAPSFIRHRARMADARQSIRSSDASIVFARFDGCMKINATDDYWDDDDLEWQVRSIDSWLGGRGETNMIHFGDCELLFEQIHGAASVLTSQRPLITLYPGRQNRHEILSLVSQLDYSVVNLGLEPVHDADIASPMDFGWIALPGESCSSSSAEAVVQFGEGCTIDDQFAYSEASPRQRRSSEVFNLGVNAAPQLTYTVGASEMICRSNGYPVESDGEKSWRWLGPRSQSRIVIPARLPGSYIVELAAIGSSAPERLADCRVLVNGREVQKSTNKLSEGKLNFVAHVDWASYTGSMELDLIIFSCRPPHPNDPRTLRICVASIGVRPWQ